MLHILLMQNLVVFLHTNAGLDQNDLIVMLGCMHSPCIDSPSVQQAMSLWNSMHTCGCMCTPSAFPMLIQ